MSKVAVLLGISAVIVVATYVVSEKVTEIPVSKDVVRITYWEKWTDFEYDAMKAVVDDFNKSQSKIHVDMLSMSGIDDKTMMAISAGIPPDVAGLYAAHVAQYVDEHGLEKLDDYLAAAGMSKKDYIPAYWDIGEYAGHQYALPSTPASIALHFNTDKYKAAGLDPTKPPVTLEELDAYSDKLTKIDKNGHAEQVGFLPNEPGWWNWAWITLFGAKYWDGKSKITCNSPEAIEAMTWVQGYPQRYGKSTIQAFTQGLGNFSSPQNPFISGKVAMELQGVWMANFIKRFGQDVQWDAAPFPYPANHPEMKNWSIVDADILAIPRGCRHPKEAFEFIRYVQQQKNMEKLCLLQRKHSPLSKVSDEFWKQHANKKIRLFYDLAATENSIQTPKIGIWSQYESELTNAFEAVMLQAKTPKQAMKDLSDTMQPKLDQYLKRRAMRWSRGL